MFAGVECHLCLDLFEMIRSILFGTDVWSIDRQEKKWFSLEPGYPSAQMHNEIYR